MGALLPLLRDPEEPVRQAVMGVLGFVLDRNKIPLGPVVLGLVLGRPLEEKLIQGLVASDGSVLGFFSRPGAAILGLLTIGFIYEWRKGALEWD